MEKKCCICGKVIDGFGNNANPVKDGICCNLCNENYVIPGRMYKIATDTPVSFEIVKSEERKLIHEELIRRDFEIVKSNNEIVLYKNLATEESVAMCMI